MAGNSLADRLMLTLISQISRRELRRWSLAACLIVLTRDATGQSARAQSIEGTARVLWGDPESGPPRLAVVVDAADGTYQLRLDEAALSAAGGAIALNGSRVRATGVAAPSAYGARVFNVQSIVTVDASSAVLSAMRTMMRDPGAHAVIRRNRRSIAFVVILCFFPDSSRVVTSTDAFRPSFSGLAPSADHYWREVSGGTIDFAGSRVVGPFTLSHPRSYYVGSSAELHLLMQECTELADPTVDFRQVGGLALQFNARLDGAAWGGQDNLTLDGQSRFVPTVWMPPGTSPGAWAHEVGHGLGLPHSSGPYGATYDSRWDVMSSPGWKADVIGNVPFIYGSQTIGYHKLLIDVMPAWREVAVGGAPVRILLESSANAASSGTQLVVVRNPDNPRVFYTAELRRQLPATYYEAQLPSQGVVIHEVDQFRASPAHVVDVDGNGDANDVAAAWTAGREFRDLERGIRIAVDSETPAGAWLTIENGRAATVVMREPRFGGDSVAFGAASSRLDSSLVSATMPGGSFDDWRVETTASWIRLSALTGSGTQWLTWSYRVLGLASGEYLDSITVRSITSPRVRAAIPVVVKVAAPSSSVFLGLSRTFVRDTATAGEWAPLFQSVLVTVPPGVSWTASRRASATRLVMCSRPFTNCSSAIATVVGAGSDTVTWIASATSASAGQFFTDTITITVAGASGSPASLVNELLVSAAPTIALTPPTRRGPVDLGSAGVPDSSRVTIVGAASDAWYFYWSSGSTLDFGISGGAKDGWLRWKRGPGARTPGRYVDTAWVGAREAIAFFADTLDVVAATPRLQLSPAGRGRTAIVGSTGIIDSTIVATVGSTAALWIAQRNSPRLRLVGGTTSVSGVQTLSRTGSVSLLYIRDLTNVTPGTYIDTISVTSTGLPSVNFIDTVIVVSAISMSPLVIAAGSTSSSTLLSTDHLPLPIRVEFPAGGNASLGSMSARVAWDPTRLSYQSTAGAVGVGTVVVATDSTAFGNVRFSLQGATLAADATLLTLTLAPRAPTSGYGNVALKVSAIASPAGASLLPQTVLRPHAVCILTMRRWGDATGDDVVNIIDAQQVARYAVNLTASNPEAVTDNGDVTGDAATNIIDAQQIARFAVGLSAPAKTGTARTVGTC
jgi:hypothetical protein